MAASSRAATLRPATTASRRCISSIVAIAEAVTDMPVQPRPVVQRYAVTVCRCQSCGRRVRGRHPDLAADQYGATAHRLGPRVLGAGHTLHYGQGVPQCKVPAILATLTGVQVTQGALLQDALRRATKYGG